MTKKLEAGGVGAIVDMGRLAMLMEPIAEDLNNMVMVQPVRRVMILAETLAKAASLNDTIGEKIAKFNVMNHLQTEGKARGSGEVSMPKAFIPDFDRVTAREGANV